MNKMIIIKKEDLDQHLNLKVQLVELAEQVNEYDSDYEYWPQFGFFDTFLRWLDMYQVPYQLQAPASYE